MKRLFSRNFDSLLLLITAIAAVIQINPNRFYNMVNTTADTTSGFVGTHSTMIQIVCGFIGLCLLPHVHRRIKNRRVRRYNRTRFIG